MQRAGWDSKRWRRVHWGGWVFGGLGPRLVAWPSVPQNVRSVGRRTTLKRCIWMRVVSLVNPPPPLGASNLPPQERQGESVPTTRLTFKCPEPRCRQLTNGHVQTTSMQRKVKERGGDEGEANIWRLLHPACRDDQQAIWHNCSVDPRKGVRLEVYYEQQVKIHSSRDTLLQLLLSHGWLNGTTKFKSVYPAFKEKIIRKHCL